MTAEPLRKTQENQNLINNGVVWLDASIDQSKENINTREQLRASTNNLLTFEDEPQCFQYIKSLSKDDQIILIVSGKLGSTIVPKIVEYQQVVSIYVYCENKRVHKKWAKNFPKVKDVINKPRILIRKVTKNQNRQKINEPNDLPPSYNTRSDRIDFERSVFPLSGDFVNSQLLIDCLIKIKPNVTDKNEFISLCNKQYSRMPGVLKVIREFEIDYSRDRVFVWYTRNSFVCQMLNKALRKQNIHLLYLFRFIIRDIKRQLKNNKCSSPVRVYRAQLMSNVEIEMFKNSIGNVISIKSFFSTTRNRDLAFFCCTDSSISDNLERVVFDIEADPQLDNIQPFSDIASYSHFPNEEEVLFMIGSIFRIVDINRHDDGILVIRMRLTSLNDHCLKSLVQRMQKRYMNRETDLLDLSTILMHMGKWNDAEKYYQRCLIEFSDNQTYVASCYQGLGSIAKKNGDYELSLELHNKSLEIKTQILKPDDPNIAASFNSIGAMYSAKKDYAHALESYEKALEIYRKSFNDDHLDVAMCKKNIGNIYFHQSKYSQALELYQEALITRERHLPVGHSSVGSVHANIGNIYQHFGQNDLALAHYNSALRIYEQSRPSEHPSVAKIMKNMAFLYDERNDSEQALVYFEEAARIYSRSLSATEPDSIQIERL